jgi:hypothetical protein
MRESLSHEDFRGIINELGLFIAPADADRLFERLERELGWKAGGPGQQVVAAFCEAYRDRYGYAYAPLPKDGSLAKAMAKAEGLEQAKHLARVYLGMNEAHYVQRCHPFELFYYERLRIKQFATHGRTVSRTEATKIDQRQASANAFSEAAARIRARGPRG